MNEFALKNFLLKLPISQTKLKHKPFLTLTHPKLKSLKCTKMIPITKINLNFVNIVLTVTYLIILSPLVSENSKTPNLAILLPNLPIQHSTLISKTLAQINLTLTAIAVVPIVNTVNLHNTLVLDIDINHDLVLILIIEIILEIPKTTTITQNHLLITILTDLAMIPTKNQIHTITITLQTPIIPTTIIITLIQGVTLNLLLEITLPLIPLPIIVTPDTIPVLEKDIITQTQTI